MTSFKDVVLQNTITDKGLRPDWAGRIPTALGHARVRCRRLPFRGTRRRMDWYADHRVVTGLRNTLMSHVLVAEAIAVTQQRVSAIENGAVAVLSTLAD